jgi:hypothetical protein
VIVAHLERYPAAVLGGLDPTEWATIIERRHRKTTPTKGRGGLDGTGRLTPAVSERFLHEVEVVQNPHLANQTTDRLVWKDCVNMRFRFTNELTRPGMLSEPWPLMVQRIQQTGDALVRIALTSLEATPVVMQIDDGALTRLEQAPMNVALLQATGIGKTVKKAIKPAKDDPFVGRTGNVQRLTILLNRWKDMAAQNGPDKDASDWKLAESSHSWLELHVALSQREASRRSAQGQRMREIRANLNADRPKVVKVRPAKAQHTKILSASSVARGSLLTPGNAKMQKIRKEASTLAHRQVTGRLASVAWSTATTSIGNFAKAVAVAACGKRKAGAASHGAAERRMRTAALPGSQRPPPASSTTTRNPKKGIAKLRKEMRR